ncbi:hypothetical protein BELL_0071g00010 [Botrytis elliptica]|uniref:Uncharacterized protein n=1 Tax=Botrytis elliptica TaxID=278938 RepID=A0A4Z1K464_9HELO|nr:hypothetical protein BELL_0071g00010 [Botrytis elliptica]
MLHSVVLRVAHWFFFKFDLKVKTVNHGLKHKNPASYVELFQSVILLVLKLVDRAFAPVKKPFHPPLFDSYINSRPSRSNIAIQQERDLDREVPALRKGIILSKSNKSAEVAIKKQKLAERIKSAQAEQLAERSQSTQSQQLPAQSQKQVANANKGKGKENADVIDLTEPSLTATPYNLIQTVARERYPVLSFVGSIARGDVQASSQVRQPDPRYLGDLKNLPRDLALEDRVQYDANNDQATEPNQDDIHGVHQLMMAYWSETVLHDYMPLDPERHGTLLANAKESIFHQEPIHFTDGLPYASNGTPLPTSVKLSDLLLGLIWQYAPPNVDLHVLWPADFDRFNEPYADRSNVGNSCAPRIHCLDYPQGGELVRDRRIGFIQILDGDGEIEWICVLGGEGYRMTGDDFLTIQIEFHHRFVEIERFARPQAVTSPSSELSRRALRDPAHHARRDQVSMFEVAYRQLLSYQNATIRQTLGVKPSRGVIFNKVMPWDFMSHVFQSAMLSQTISNRYRDMHDELWETAKVAMREYETTIQLNSASNELLTARRNLAQSINANSSLDVELRRALSRVPEPVTLLDTVPHEIMPEHHRHVIRQTCDAIRQLCGDVQQPHIAFDSNGVFVENHDPIIEPERIRTMFMDSYRDDTLTKLILGEIRPPSDAPQRKFSSHPPLAPSDKMGSSTKPSTPAKTLLFGKSSHGTSTGRRCTTDQHPVKTSQVSPSGPNRSGSSGSKSVSFDRGSGSAGKRSNKETSTGSTYGDFLAHYGTVMTKAECRRQVVANND